MATVRVYAHVNLALCGLVVGSVIELDDSDPDVAALIARGFLEVCPDCELTGTCDDPGGGAPAPGGSGGLDPTTTSRASLSMVLNSSNGLASGSSRRPTWEETEEGITGTDIVFDPLADPDTGMVTIAADGVYAFSFSADIAGEAGGTLAYAQFTFGAVVFGGESTDYFEEPVDEVARKISDCFFLPAATVIHPSISVDTNNPGVTTWKIFFADLLIQRVV